MKKLSVKKEIILGIMIIAMVFAISTSVFASSNPVTPPNVSLPPMDGDGNNTQDSNSVNDEIPIANQNTVQPTTQNTQNTISTYQNTTLPQTGDASDYAIFMVIVVAIIVAVYAYKKVRDYNI